MKDSAEDRGWTPWSSQHIGKERRREDKACAFKSNGRVLHARVVQPTIIAETNDVLNIHKVIIHMHVQLLNNLIFQTKVSRCCIYFAYTRISFAYTCVLYITQYITSSM